jgi:penicillin-binding protein 1A
MRLLSALISLALVAVGAGAVLVAMVFAHYSKDLPDYSYLKDYQPPTLSRIYADDGRMMAVVAEEQRIFVPINAIPKRVIVAFLSAEDADFYQHGGVDYSGILRAAFVNLHNMGHDKHPMGASTITQQVAKNMLLTNEVSLARKIREAILATRLEKALSKDRILEIYLNEIFLGNHSYGVAAAALNYFNKSLDELTVDEAAYLAALPKGPNNYNLVHEHAKAVERRNYVIGRMAENGYISHTEADAAEKQPLEGRVRDDAESVNADYFSEEVRRQLIDKFGEDEVLQDGLAVKTSLDPKLQNAATEALRNGLISFDRRERGWRGAVAHMTDFGEWQKKLKAIALPAGGEYWQLAVVYGFKNNEAQIALIDNTRGFIPWTEMSWARRELADDQFGPAIHKPSDVLNVGDVVMVEPVKTGEDGKPYAESAYTLRQVPVVQGAIVVLDPHTGRVFALNGGFSTKMSQFDRATQAMRQPGSSFKPFVYMAALDKGFTPASLIMDSPFDYYQGPGLPLWHPENYGDEDFGPTPLRVGIEKSQNVMTVRIANAIGMPIVVDYAKKFGIVDDMPNFLAYALGSKETTPLRMATAYGMIVNGGKKITPSLIDRVQDREGKTIWRADNRECKDCMSAGWTPQLLPPDIPDTREQIEDPRTTYQMVNILTGVVQRGTAAKLHDIDFPLAGKTGTTNDSKDAWFVGFTPDLVCAVYVGFDNPVPLGSKETGASVAVPVFRSFITQAIKGKPPVPFRVPPGLRMVRVNPRTEALAGPSDKDAIWESFIPGTEPQEGQVRTVLDGSVTGSASMGVGAMAPPGSTPGATPPPPAALPVIGEDGFPVAPQSDGMPAPAIPAVPPASISGTGGLY